MKQLSIHETFQFAWNTFLERPIFFAGIALITTIIPRIITELPILLAFENIATYDEVQFMVLQVLLIILYFGVLFYFAISLIKIFLKVIDREPVFYRDLFKVTKHELLVMFGAGFIYTFFVLIGLVFLIIPGIYLVVKYWFYPYFVIEKKLDPMDALRESEMITKGHVMKLCGIGILALGLELSGVIISLLTNVNIIPIPGLSTVLDYAASLITLPLLGLVGAYLYRTLSHTYPTRTQ